MEETLGYIETAFYTLLDKMEENMPDYDETYANEVREEVDWACELFKENMDILIKTYGISDEYLTKHYLT